MILKIKNILDKVIVICIILLFPVQFTYYLYQREQLTAKSFEEIINLNNELKNLEPMSDEVFFDEENLNYNINKYISPNLFDKYYFLKYYISDYKYVQRFYPRINELQKIGLSESDLSTLSKTVFLSAESIENDIKSFSDEQQYTDLKKFYNANSIRQFKIKNISDLVINSELISSLLKLKDVPYKSKEEFEQALREEIGLDNFKKYSVFITSTLDDTTYWQKMMLLSFIIVFALSIILRIIVALIFGARRKNFENQEIQNEIDKAKQEIDQKPKEIAPVWDLAYYTLQKYYNKNLSQINSIYKLSIAVMVMGFLLIISILISSIFFQIDVGIESVGIIAGIITEFIGATFLFIYKSTIKQALQHSNSLEEINKLGMSIKIIESIPESKTNSEKIEDAKIKIAEKLITTHNTRL